MPRATSRPEGGSHSLPLASLNKWSLAISIGNTRVPCMHGCAFHTWAELSSQHPLVYLGSAGAAGDVAGTPLPPSHLVCASPAVVLGSPSLVPNYTFPACFSQCPVAPFCSSWGLHGLGLGCGGRCPLPNTHLLTWRTAPSSPALTQPSGVAVSTWPARPGSSCGAPREGPSDHLPLGKQLP